MGGSSGGILGEGKTKIILVVEGDPSAVDLSAKPDITAFDDSKFTKQIEKKPEYSTSTTSRVFELLKASGIPVAYREQISPTCFRADKCTMIALEVVARRYAVGSFLKRHPELKQDPPLRFSRLEIEFFLKTTNGGFLDRWGQQEDLHLNAEKGEEDPFIIDPHADFWQLVHSKKPSWDETAKLGGTKAVGVIDDIRDEDGKFVLIEEMDEIARQVFLVLEKVWGMMGCRFIDLKIEFGITPDGRLVVADVIDNDSWRLRDKLWMELSKQAFRDGEDLDEVERKYEIVAALLEQFRVPEQVMVSWRGSEKDSPLLLNAEYESIPGIVVEEITLSGHKQARKCLDRLEELQRDYPSGVIVANIGMSDGLAPILGAHTTWPVIAIPATIDECPEDVWSSLRTPSRTPVLTCLKRNAIGAALNILAQHNPTLYMQQQLAIEELDC